MSSQCSITAIPLSKSKYDNGGAAYHHRARPGRLRLLLLARTSLLGRFRLLRARRWQAQHHVRDLNHSDNGQRRLQRQHRLCYQMLEAGRQQPEQDGDSAERDTLGQGIVECRDRGYGGFRFAFCGLGGWPSCQC